MRGIMNFDDFNYKQFNQYVLLEEPHESEKKRVIEDRKQINTQRARGNSVDKSSTLS